MGMDRGEQTTPTAWERFEAEAERVGTVVGVLGLLGAFTLPGIAIFTVESLSPWKGSAAKDLGEVILATAPLTLALVLCAGVAMALLEEAPVACVVLMGVVFAGTAVGAGAVGMGGVDAGKVWHDVYPPHRTEAVKRTSCSTSPAIGPFRGRLTCVERTIVPASETPGGPSGGWGKLGWAWASVKFIGAMLKAYLFAYGILSFLSALIVGGWLASWVVRVLA
jgi:hypothetical protein